MSRAASSIRERSASFSFFFSFNVLDLARRRRTEGRASRVSFETAEGFQLPATGFMFDVPRVVSTRCEVDASDEDKDRKTSDPVHRQRERDGEILGTD